MSRLIYTIRRTPEKKFIVLLNGDELSKHETLLGANEACGRYKIADERRKEAAKSKRK